MNATTIERDPKDGAIIITQQINEMVMAQIVELTAAQLRYGLELATGCTWSPDEGELEF